MEKGMIFDLKRFAVHDGGGLRSTLFLKGCPLRCPWCQNPEGLERRPLVWYSPTDCLRCGTCVAACEEKVLCLGTGPACGKENGAGRQDESRKTEEERIHIRRDACTLCGACENACPAAAIEVRGREVTSREAADMLLRDRVFFADGGGVTLSGGECLAQWKFASRVLSLCREAGADTAIESCLLAPREAVEAMLPVTDHFLIDIKYLDGETHRRVLGADNRQILENYEYLVSCGAHVLVRTPLIPGYTATEENIRSIARYVHGIDPGAGYELLNFNPLCRSKYEVLEQAYPVEERSPLKKEEMDFFYRILEEEGIQNIVRE